MRRFLLWCALLCAGSAMSAPNVTFRAVILSDFNGPYGSTTYPAPLGRVMHRTLNEWKPDLFLSAGDVIAGQKHGLTDANVRAMWAAFDRDVTGPLRGAGIPFAFAVGNHDGSSARSGGVFTFERDRRLLTEYWNAPGRAPALAFVDRSLFPFAFSFSFQGVFFVVVDASGNQLQHREWLEAQLAGDASRTAGMRVVIGHLPLYAVSEGRSNAGNVLSGSEQLRTLFEKYGVHTYVSGHHAAYYPGRRGKLNVLATGGIGGRDYLGFKGTARSTVTVAEFDVPAREIHLRTFDAVTGAEVDVRSLPARINGFGGSVERTPVLR